MPIVYMSFYLFQICITKTIIQIVKNVLQEVYYGSTLPQFPKFKRKHLNNIGS